MPRPPPDGRPAALGPLGGGAVRLCGYLGILHDKAPTAYEFGYELPEGYNLSERNSGGILILNGEEDAVGFVEK